MRVRWHSLARQDLQEAARFYEAQREGRGDRFLDAVNSAIKLIRFWPAAGTPVGTRVRRVLVHRFPYSVVYEVQSAEAHILAVLHDRRGEEIWRTRMWLAAPGSL